MKVPVSMIAAVGVTLVLAGPSRTQPVAAPVAPASRELVVGTKEAPPFAMKAADGSWQGISIDLWRRIADQMHLRYRLVEEPTVQALLDATAAKRTDVAVAAVTVTAARERVVDFTHSFYDTGLGIAVPMTGAASWVPVVRTMTSFGFVQAVLALIGIALAVGILIWVFERNRNEDFGGGVAKGLGSSVWWSAVAMTQASTGEIGPTTFPGRLLAIIWMVASVIAIAIFTAGITSALTTKQLLGLVQNVGDLSSVRVGAVAGSATEDALTQMRVRFRGFRTPQDGLKALRDRTIDAFVYDKPLLAWIVLQEFSSSAQILDFTFDPQRYAFALPEGSPLREQVNLALLETIQSDWWKQTLFRYMGQK
jgi:ABC-type amino acid transport substrate-binding protein